METGSSSKQEVLERLLERGMVMVTLDARRPGVDVPVRFQDDAQLRLNLSRRFGLPMEVNDWGVRATLTFAGSPHVCKLPWSAIYQVVSHVAADHYLFPDEVPEEFVRSAVDGRREAPPQRPRPRLALVQGDGDGDVMATEDDAEPPHGEAKGGGPEPEPPRPPLRRIK